MHRFMFCSPLFAYRFSSLIILFACHYPPAAIHFLPNGHYTLLLTLVNSTWYSCRSLCRKSLSGKGLGRLRWARAAGRRFDPAKRGSRRKLLCRNGLRILGE
jgi:hypothetical protein